MGPARQNRARPDCPLSKREFEALALLCEGLSYVEIAKRMGVSYSTVRSTLHTGYQRLGVYKGAEAIARMIGAGWLDPVSEDWHDARLTAAQHLYLEAFDKLLGGGARVGLKERSRNRRDEGEQKRAAEEMHHHLGSLYMEAEKPMPDQHVDRRHPNKGLDRLLALVLAPIDMV